MHMTHARGDMQRGLGVVVQAVGVGNAQENFNRDRVVTATTDMYWTGNFRLNVGSGVSIC